MDGAHGLQPGRDHAGPFLGRRLVDEEAGLGVAGLVGGDPPLGEAHDEEGLPDDRGVRLVAEQLRHRRVAQMGGPEPARAGHERLDLAGRSNSADLFLIAAAFSEHAQFKHGARSAGEIKDHIA